MERSNLYLLVCVMLCMCKTAGAWEKIIKTSVENKFFNSVDAWISTNTHNKIVYRLKVQTTGPKAGGWSVAHTYIYKTNLKQTWKIEIGNIQCTSDEMIQNEGDTGEIEVEFDDWYRIRLEVHADVKEFNYGQGDPEGAFSYSEAIVQLFEGEPEISDPFDSYNYVDETEAAKFIVFPNYPNPFNPSTNISFILPSAGFATLTIYNITGRKVRELVSEKMSAGINTVIWNGADLTGRKVSSGVYFYQINSGAISKTDKMILIR